MRSQTRYGLLVKKIYLQPMESTIRDGSDIFMYIAMPHMFSYQEFFYG